MENRYTIGPAPIIGWIVYDEKRHGIADFYNEKDAIEYADWLNSKALTAPEKWTIERVFAEVSPRHDYSAHGELLISPFPIEGKTCATETDLKKWAAFRKLLTCAHWANDGCLKMDAVPKDRYSFRTSWQYENISYTMPVPIRCEAAKNKFLSIEGIEPLLKTFFGID
jgi:hypothetical protein